jgi:hypothetical protein
MSPDITRWLTSEIDLVDCVKGGALGYFPTELSPGSLAATGIPWLPNIRLGVQPGGEEY